MLIILKEVKQQLMMMFNKNYNILLVKLQQVMHKLINQLIILPVYNQVIGYMINQ